MYVVNIETVEPFRISDNTEVRELVTPRISPVRNSSLAEARVAPGELTAEHIHAKTEEVYLITRGSGEMSIDGERHAVSAGDAVVIPPGMKHWILNSGTDTLVFLSWCSPPFDIKDTTRTERH